ncbi:hypothetical protein [Stenotrophomonas maltophilia]|jgi:hypothetical protein|nr:hypothetical protein [Stenotrophomonas maltophilia]
MQSASNSVGEPSTLKPKLRALFRPQGEGWQVVEVKDEGTSAG